MEERSKALKRTSGRRKRSVRKKPTDSIERSAYTCSAHTTYGDAKQEPGRRMPCVKKAGRLHSVVEQSRILSTKMVATCADAGFGATDTDVSGIARQAVM